MTIHGLRAEIKSTLERLNSRELYTILLILFVGLGSFGLGRLSRLQELATPIKIENVAAVGSVIPLNKGGAESAKAEVVTPPQSSPSKVVEAEKTGGQLVASKGGAKYHFPWCSGAQRIAEANKIWFNSIEEARKAGYTAAANCKGLK